MSGAICAICYEDARPVCEDLQSISACGHVFHELWCDAFTTAFSFASSRYLPSDAVIGALFTFFQTKFAFEEETVARVNDFRI